VGLGACLAAGVSVRGETLDRVVAAVDYRAITERDVEIEFRFEKFLNGEQPAGNPDAKAREEIRNRLVQQALLAQEVPNLSASPVPEETVAAELADIQKKFDSPEAYQAALRSLGLDTNQVLDRLRLRETILELIEKRLRPQAWADNSEIENYYHDTFIPAFKQHNPGPAPDLADVQDKIREILTQGKINTLLDQWISDLKATYRVELFSD
jgi:hypothetical protein